MHNFIENPLFVVIGSAIAVIGFAVGTWLSDVPDISRSPKSLIIKDVVYTIQVDTLATDSLNRIAVRKLVKK